MQILNANTFYFLAMQQETVKLQQYQLHDKLLFGYCDGTNVFVTFNEFIREFAQSIPPATLQRKNRAVIQPHEERHCSGKYPRLFKAVNVVGKEDISDNADAGTVAHRAPSG